MLYAHSSPNYSSTLSKLVCNHLPYPQSQLATPYSILLTVSQARSCGGGYPVVGGQGYCQPRVSFFRFRAKFKFEYFWILKIDSSQYPTCGKK